MWVFLHPNIPCFNKQERKKLYPSSIATYCDRIFLYKIIAFSIIARNAGSLVYWEYCGIASKNGQRKATASACRRLSTPRRSPLNPRYKTRSTHSFIPTDSLILKENCKEEGGRTEVHWTKLTQWNLWAQDTPVCPWVYYTQEYGWSPTVFMPEK